LKAFALSVSSWQKRLIGLTHRAGWGEHAGPPARMHSSRKILPGDFSQFRIDGHDRCYIILS